MAGQFQHLFTPIAEAEVVVAYGRGLGEGSMLCESSRQQLQ